MTVCVAIGFLTMTTGAWGQAGGEASVTVGDAEYAFTLNAAQSDWRGSASLPSISMSLAAGGEARESGVLALSLGFEMTGGQLISAEARLLRKSGDGTEWLYCEDEIESGGLAIEVETIAEDGETLSVQGRMTCELGTSENFGRDIDLSNAVPVSSAFNVKLQRL